MTALGTIRRVHRAVMPETDYPWTICAHCEQVWPCDARIVLDYLDEHEWTVAVGCTTAHAYGDEGWRPGGPGQPHEHRVR